jgi:hypothetical protein
VTFGKTWKVKSEHATLCLLVLNRDDARANFSMEASVDSCHDDKMNEFWNIVD